ncbi:MAG TPA: hypothetical protein VD994_14620 [Prosthecobacter sp.]|nr:hypothetical protein [Prosthecobacter sp.]
MINAVLIPGTFFICLKSAPNLVLGMANGRAALAWRNTEDRSQLWQIYQYTLASDLYLFVNVSLGGGLFVGNYGDVLTTAINGTAWNIPGGISNEVIRVASNTNWNLNALGGGPYDVGTPVAVWNWTNNGAPNQSWQITNVSNLPNPADGGRYVIASNRTAITPQDGDMNGRFGLACGTGSSTPQTDLKKIYIKTQWSNGFSLRNAYNSKFIYFSGPNQTVAQSASLSMRTLWDLKALDDSKVRGPVRPALDTTQNLNALGNPDDFNGTPVGTWDWGGGERNEIWSLIAT